MGSFFLTFPLISFPFFFSFNYFGFLNPETIEKLISREDLTIEELLDEDNIVQEIKGSSEKFGNL